MFSVLKRSFFILLCILVVGFIEYNLELGRILLILNRSNRWTFMGMNFRVWLFKVFLTFFLNNFCFFNPTCVISYNVRMIQFDHSSYFSKNILISNFVNVLNIQTYFFYSINLTFQFMSCFIDLTKSTLSYKFYITKTICEFIVLIK